ncbi:dnaJ homolog subfamily C member 1 isoform X2 [Adelges cooleyi]|uniref:dnaJ homolog subfamily C member 1 isoform X2 n=1 Tax=Adelges cooleyi TaxID=133065 RepID=UPI00217F66E6|nr:dnaJ homolog subfamily C member 1 isoform X2 [Adelges cooleyi]
MTGSKMLAVICVILAFSTRSILGWEAEQMEVFDLVEELNNLNFYKFLDVSPEANSSTIRQAFRRMSLQLHPDKNDAPDAEVRFRELVSIHDVLRDPKKRAHYDKVLKEGLPDWHHALYYYRRVRKMGFLEMLVILFSIISVGQYLVAWGSYIENKITVEELLSSKVRKLRKQKKYRGDSTLPPEFDVNIPKPSLKDTLPCQIPYWLWIFVLNLPSLTTSAISFLVTKFKERTTCESNEEPEKPEPIVRERVRRRKVQYKIPEINEYKNTVVENRAKTNLDKSEPPVVSGGLWTDDDLYELSQMVNKYPAGTSDRWQKVAKAMHRPVPEVAYMANKMKENGYKVPTPGETQESVVTEEPKKIKTRSTTNTESTDSAWNQVQQKALESALTKYPKGSTENRWEKIAKCVPNKTKEECMARFKEVVQMVKKKNNSTDEPLENGDVGTTE